MLANAPTSVNDETAMPAVPILARRWARRALCLGTLAILVCTLFPFQFLLKETAWRRMGPFWLWLNPYPDDPQDFLENVLLFLPFGFAWGCLAAEKRWRWLRGSALALVAGAGLSFAVEVSQTFLPTRDAGWGDVVSNALGSLVGYLVFFALGDRLLLYASHCEAGLERVLSGRRLALAFVAYAALCGFLCRGALVDPPQGLEPLGHSARNGARGVAEHLAGGCPGPIRAFARPHRPWAFPAVGGGR